jgi:hypothetical protein
MCTRAFFHSQYEKRVAGSGLSTERSIFSNSSRRLTLSRIYVAPVGILHYIAAHWYKPPMAFVEAVMACPPMQSMAYKRELLANGGRVLMRCRALVILSYFRMVACQLKSTSFLLFLIL